MTPRRLRLIVPYATLGLAVAIGAALPFIDPITDDGQRIDLAGEDLDEVGEMEPVSEPSASPGVSAGSITVGVLGALTGDESEVGKSVVDGHHLYWEAVNRYGGIGGYAIEILVRDGGLDSAQASGAYEQLEARSALISSTLGTPLIAEDALSDGVIVVADSPVTAWSEVPNIALNAAQATYAVEMQIGAMWATGRSSPGLEGLPVGLLYQADAYGEDCLAGLRSVMGELNLSPVSIESYDQAAEHLNEQTQAFAAAGADLLFVCSDPLHLGQLVIAADALGYSPTVIATSGSYTPHLAFALGGGEYGYDEAETTGLALLSDVYIVSSVPPFEAEEAGMADFRRAIEAAGLSDEEINASLWIGYTQAATAHAILETAVGSGDLSRAGLAVALGETDSIDLELGMPPAGYGPAPSDRIPCLTAALYQPVSVSERAFGLEPLTDWLSVP